jgi:hypothetical protein
MRAAQARTLDGLTHRAFAAYRWVTPYGLRQPLGNGLVQNVLTKTTDHFVQETQIGHSASQIRILGEECDDHRGFFRRQPSIYEFLNPVVR